MSDEEGRAGEPRRRSVYVSQFALVEEYDDAGNVVSSERVRRNTYPLVSYLETLDKDSVVGIYLVEDEKMSEEPPEGEERLRSPLLPPRADQDGNQQPSDRVLVADAIAMLTEATVPDRLMLAQFHDLFDRASATTHLDGGMITLVFDGHPCGFAYINSCRDVLASSMGVLYETAKSQLGQLKENLRGMAPGLVFSDDGTPDAGNPVVLPDGSVAGDRRVVTPAEAAREAEEQGLTRIVRVVD